MKMPFGKHKGLELEELAEDYPDYVVWLAEKCDLHGDLFYFIGEHYEACKIKARNNRRRNYLWSYEDIANMEAEWGADYGDYGYDDGIPMCIPNFDY